VNASIQAVRHGKERRREVFEPIPATRPRREAPAPEREPRREPVETPKRKREKTPA
jgi:hypothetical protein